MNEVQTAKTLEELLVEKWTLATTQTEQLGLLYGVAQGFDDWHRITARGRAEFFVQCAWGSFFGPREISRKVGRSALEKAMKSAFSEGVWSGPVLLDRDQLAILEILTQVDQEDMVSGYFQKTARKYLDGFASWWVSDLHRRRHPFPPHWYDAVIATETFDLFEKYACADSITAEHLLIALKLLREYQLGEDAKNLPISSHLNSEIALKEHVHARKIAEALVLQMGRCGMLDEAIKIGRIGGEHGTDTTSP